MGPDAAVAGLVETGMASMSIRSPRPSASIVVRDATPEDCGAIAAIYAQAVRAGRSTMDTVPLPARYFREVLAAASPREALLVADAAGRVVGWAQTKRYSERPGYAPACETTVYVAEEATGMGTGSRLMEALLTRARDAGHHHLVAKILASNEDSVRFHERLGFERVGTQREIGWLNGAWQDVVILQRILEAGDPR